MNILKWTVGLFILLTSPCYAFFCPNNFSQINIGDTQAQVLSACGKPIKEEKKDVDIPVPQEWTYFVVQSVSAGMNGNLDAMVGTLKTTFNFDEAGRAINISVNGIGVGGTDICGTYVQLGSTRDQVKAACGTPSNISRMSNAQLSDKPDVIPKKQQIELTYTGGILVFEDGVLIENRKPE